MPTFDVLAVNLANLVTSDIRGMTFSKDSVPPQTMSFAILSGKGKMRYNRLKRADHLFKD